MYVCLFLGFAGTAETAKCSTVLPAAYAAAADQQCPTAQLGCRATGNQSYEIKIQSVQKYGKSKH